MFYDIVLFFFFVFFFFASMPSFCVSGLFCVPFCGSFVTHFTFLKLIKSHSGWISGEVGGSEDSPSSSFIKPSVLPVKQSLKV